MPPTCAICDAPADDRTRLHADWNMRLLEERGVTPPTTGHHEAPLCSDHASRVRTLKSDWSGRNHFSESDRSKLEDAVDDVLANLDTDALAEAGMV